MSDTRRPTEDALRAQLAELNARCRAHIAALWQVPLAYITVIGVIFGLVPPSPWVPPMGIGLATVGLVLIWAMCGWSISTQDAVMHLRRVEEQLGLEVTAKTRHVGHELPHFLLVVLGIAGALLLGFAF